MKKIIIFCAFYIVTLFASAQTEERKWNIGFQGGLVQYNGDLGNDFYKTDQAAYGFGGISFSRYLSKHFDASLNFTRGEVGYASSSPQVNTWTYNSFTVRHNTVNLVAKFNFTGPQAVVRPYLFLGGGIMWFEALYKQKHERYEYAFPNFGGGLTFNLSPIVALQLQESFMYSNTDDVDRLDNGGNNDMFLYHSAGITFNLGKKKDGDKDGVSDKKDKCPNTPSGVAVDEFGCPLDRDGDGVLDYQDVCPDVTGTQTLKGCPDKDMDGITDKEDRCPDAAGPIEMAGCPDSDKDGVSDVDDKCAGTKTGYKVDATGCTLDNDKDGIVNEEDLCPDLVGTMAFKGCPDTDGDGVSDKEDRCPLVKGTLENKGCPEIPREDIVKINVIASKIYFETGSAKLKLISNSQLDDLATILNRNSAVNMTIEGHTDNVGDDAYNMDLSQKRTESVREYLISKGVSASRLTAIGYGETKPIADNAKAAGKAKNRRVELKTSY